MTFNTASIPIRSTEAHGSSVQLGIADILTEITDALGRQLVAFMIGRDARTLSRWLERRDVPAEAENNLRSVFMIYRTVLSVDAAHTARAWFMGMNPQLDDNSPAERLAEGHYREVLMAARAFTTGG